MPVRIAAVVLAYRYPAGLSALARFFNAADIDMFVHVDAKIDDRPFRLAAKSASRDVIFVEDRVRIFWRGFTMVEATIGLLKAAKAHGGYDRYLIISDDSLPLVAPAEFRRTLEIAGDYVTARPVSDHLRLRYDRFLMFDSEATQVRWIATVDREVSEDMLQRLARLGSLRKRGKKPLAFYYHGSQWMGLTSTSVEKILASWGEDPWLRESFEFSEVPDEAYFHTIISEHGAPEWRTLVYADWSAETPPRVFKTLEELHKLDAHHALFVRKIDLQQGDLDLWMARILTGAR